MTSERRGTTMRLLRAFGSRAAGLLAISLWAGLAQGQEAAVMPDVHAAAQWAPSGAATEGGYRWSLSRGALDIGLSFEARQAAPRPADARFDSAAPTGVALPALSLGLRS